MNTKLLNVQTSKSLWLTILQRPLLLLKENLISVICESDISRMCTCVCIHECLYARVCVCMLVSISVLLRLGVWSSLCVYVCVCVCGCVCVCVCVCVCARIFFPL